MIQPDAPPASPNFNNAFGHATDPTGAKCPLHAHVRVAYSRDQPLRFPNAQRFPKGPPRLIRRGFSYGEKLDSAEDDGKDRGLFGLSLCARINEQFYTVPRWMQRTDFSDVFQGLQPGRAGQDSLVGSRRPGGDNRDDPATTTVVTAAGVPTPISLPPFSRYKGVATLFLPSMTALLAAI